MKRSQIEILDHVFYPTINCEPASNALVTKVETIINHANIPFINDGFHSLVSSTTKDWFITENSYVWNHEILDPCPYLLCINTNSTDDSALDEFATKKAYMAIRSPKLRYENFNDKIRCPQAYIVTNDRVPKKLYDLYRIIFIDDEKDIKALYSESEAQRIKSFSNFLY